VLALVLADGHAVGVVEQDVGRLQYRVREQAYRGAVDLLPGRLVWPADGGLAVMSGTTDQGMQLTMVKQAEIKTGKVNFRVDTKYGVAVTNTEMCGIELFSQP
jgi:hypothetical protein